MSQLESRRHEVERGAMPARAEQHAWECPLAASWLILPASSGGLGGADERFDHGVKNDQAIGGAESGFHGALGMRHEAGDVAFAVADAGDVVHRAVGIASAVIGAIRRCVAEDDLASLFKLGERGFIAGV